MELESSGKEMSLHSRQVEKFIVTYVCERKFLNLARILVESSKF